MMPTPIATTDRPNWRALSDSTPPITAAPRYSVPTPAVPLNHSRRRSDRPCLRQTTCISGIVLAGK